MKTLVIILIAQITLIKAETNCSFDNAFRFFNEIVFTDFTSFDELKFDNCKSTINMGRLTFHPAKKIVLNNQLKLSNINISIKNIEKFFKITLRNIFAFDLSTDPFENITIIDSNKLLIFKFIFLSNFNFMYKNITLNENCDPALMHQYYWQNYIFRGKQTCFELNANEYSSNICVLIFRNSLANFLMLKKIISSLISRSEFIIKDSNEINSDELNSNINILSLYTYRTVLNNEILNEKVFRSLTFIEINGCLNSIQDDVFKSFQLLKTLAIRMQYIKNIFALNNKWLQYLNYNEYIDLSKGRISYEQCFFLILYQTFHKKIFYAYTQEDFCYFHDFPHLRAVLPILKPSFEIINSSFTCTHLFLIQYSYILKDRFHLNFQRFDKSYEFSNYYFDEILAEFGSRRNRIDNIEKLIQACNFDRLIANCNLKQATSLEEKENKFYLQFDDWEIFSKFIHLFIFLTDKSLSFICLFLNILSIIITSNKNINREMKKTYLYLRIYIILNCFYILILFTKFVCFRDIIYCYKTNVSLKAQYFKFISIRIISNIFKTASNITYLSFTLSRYITATNSKSKVFKYFNYLSLKLYCLILFSFSILINVYTYFVTGFIDANFHGISYNSFELSISGSNNLAFKLENIDDYIESFEISQIYLFNALQIIRIIFSDLICIILVFKIDISLLLFIIKQMKMKETLTITNNNYNLINKQRKLLLFKKKRKNKNSEKRLTSLIVLNGINFILFKLPSAIVNFYGFFYYYDTTNKQFKPNLTDYIICRHFKFCENITELAQIFYFFSFIFQFFIFLKLDNNFHDIFFILYSKLKVRLRTHLTRTRTEQE